MTETTDDSFQAQCVRWFWMLLAVHVVAWTLVPSLTASNHTLDGLEMATWGREWQLGYYKHPPLPAWIARALTQAFGSHPWSLYAAASVASGTCLWAAFTLGRRVMTPAVGLMAAAALETCHYFTFTSVEFNNNIVSRAFAAVAVVFVHQAMTSRRTAHWAVAGASLGLALLAKYDVAVLAVALLAYSVLRAEPRKNWRTPGPYVMLATSLLVFGPHLWWAWQHDFPTLSYAAGRSTPAESWIDHVVRPLKFVVSQLAAVAPVLGLLAWAMGRRQTDGSLEQPTDAHSIRREDVVFVNTVVWGVFGTIVFAAMVTGAGVRSMWGSSLWTFLGVAGVVALCTRTRWAVSALAVRRTVGTGLAVSVVLLAVLSVRHSLGPEINGKLSRVHFPGEALANAVESAWDDVSEAPLPTVAGSYWLAGNVSLMGEDDASMYIDADSSKSFWTDDATLARAGGAIVWQGDEPTELLARFPSRQPVIKQTLTNPGHGDVPCEVFFCIVPPRTITAAAGTQTMVE